MLDDLLSLRDPPALTALIERARQHKMTPQEVFDQRVSFVWGQMRGDVTKEWVRARLSGEGWDD